MRKPRFINGLFMKFVACLTGAVLCSAVFGGCILFGRDSKEDYAQVVARLQNINVGTDVSPEYYTKEITKRELLVAFYNSGGSAPTKDALETQLDNLIEKELIIAQFKRMENAGQMSVNTADRNQAWKAVYDYVNGQINTELQGVYEGKPVGAPQAGSGSYSPTYPASTLLSFEQRTEDYRNEIAAYNSQTEWVPEAVNIPRDDDANMKTAVKLALLSLAAQFDTIKLTSAERDALKADKEFINDYSRSGADLYLKIMGKKRAYGGAIADADGGGYFFIKKLIYDPQLDQVRYGKMQTYYNNSVGTILSINEPLEVSGSADDKVTVYVNKFDEKITDFYNRTLAEQKSKFAGGDLSAYFSALKNDDGKTPFVLYHPSDEFVYVKHILIPFSDAQKADIDKAVKENNWDSSGEKARKYREQKAAEIVSYRHVKGEDDKTASIPIASIVSDILTVMSGKSGNLKAADEAFTELIHKYNTDPGAFNNEKGYLIPPKGKGLSSGMVEAFDTGAYAMFGKTEPGRVLTREMLSAYTGAEAAGDYVVSEYGAHVMYFASRSGYGAYNGAVGLGNEYWTSPLRLTTYKQGIFEYLLKNEQSTYFSEKSAEITRPYTKSGANFVIKYENRYKDLWQNNASASGN